jgi:(1->4)-alpha-D-glucan 1-alpha-D-glucosylmutase
VYRIYPVGGQRSEEDERFFSQALIKAPRPRWRPPILSSSIKSRSGSAVRVATMRSKKNRVNVSAILDRGRDRDRDRQSAGVPNQNLQANSAGSNSSGSHRRNAQTLFSQLTSPVAAKAIEDTACYRYGRLISRNEVGADPGEFSLSVDAFHAGVISSAPNASRTRCSTPRRTTTNAAKTCAHGSRG